jgi:hypothetical protein
MIHQFAGMVAHINWTWEARSRRPKKAKMNSTTASYKPHIPVLDSVMEMARGGPPSRLIRGHRMDSLSHRSLHDLDE